MAVFEITDKTILKILVRRGLDSERKQVRLDEGELGYTIDSKRLFVGDGLGGGGAVVGNIFQGVVPDAFTVLGTAGLGLQYGDLIYDSSESTFFVVNDEDATTLYDVGPRYEENVLEKTSSDLGYVRIAETCLGKFNPGTGDRRKAFFLDYSISEPFYKTNKVIEMNSDYWAITSISSFDPAKNDGIFYLGDIKSVSTSNPKLNLSARLNIDVSNPADGMKQGLVIWGLGGKVISFGANGGIGNSTGTTEIIGLSGITFHPDSDNPTILNKKMEIQTDGDVIFFDNDGNLAEPDFNVLGFAKFDNDMRILGDLTVQGNITAYGDFSVFETYLTVTSSLSVINATPATALYVEQDNSNHFVMRSWMYDKSHTFLLDDDCDVLMGFSEFYEGGRNDNTASSLPQINVNSPANGANIVVGGDFYVRDGRNGGGSKVASTFDVNINNKVKLFGTNRSYYDNNAGHSFTRGYYTSPNVDGNIIPDDVNNSIVAINANGGDEFPSNIYRGLIVRSNNAAGAGTAILQLAEENNSSGGGSDARYCLYITAKNGSGVGGVDIEKFSVRSNGNLYTDGSIFAEGDVTAFYSSDRDIKDNITAIDSPLEKIEKINGVMFDWKPEYKDKMKPSHDVGVIAQEVEAVLPEATKTRKDGIKAVNYDKLIPLLIESVKELNSKVNKLIENK